MVEVLSVDRNNINYCNSAYAYKSNLADREQLPNRIQNECYSQSKYPIQSKNKKYTKMNTSIKDRLLEIGGILTVSTVGLGGLNLLLYGLQKIVNEKLLIGKINEHFTKKLENPSGLLNLGFEMLQKHGLQNKVGIFKHTTDKSAAFFDSAKNIVVLGEKEFSACFHEIGHAVIENNTKLLKFLQKSRNNYNLIAIASYLGLRALANNYNENKYRNALTGQKETMFDKTKKFILKNKWVVPFLAFAPELITEGAATHYGLKFLKEKLNQGVISKNTYKNIKGSYLACFGTYFFIPLSILIIDKTANLITDVFARNRREAVKNKFRRRINVN